MSRAEEIIQKYTQQQIWDKFEQLPEKVQDVMMSPASVKVIADIAKTNGIPQKTSQIIRYVDFILFGIIPITLFKETLEQELSITGDLAKKLALEIRDKIFMEVKDELRKIHNL